MRAHAHVPRAIGVGEGRDVGGIRVIFQRERNLRGFFSQDQPLRAA